jgi:hypothetical protein
MVEVSFSADLIEAVNLSNEAYNSLSSSEDGNDTFSSDFLETYNVQELVNSNGDVVFGIENKTTGDLFVAVRGTDSLLDDGRQYDNVIFGLQTDLGRRAVEATIAFSEQHGGQKITVVGHSLGGHAAEEVARFVPHLVDDVYNIQGPAIKELVVGFDVLPVFETSLLGNMINGIPVTRLGTTKLEFGSFLGIV